MGSHGQMMGNHELSSPILLDSIEEERQTRPRAPRIIRYVVSHSFDIYLTYFLDKNSIIVTRNLSEHFRRVVNDSINYNIALILMSFAKIIASIVVLKAYDTECDYPLKNWVLLMMSHDFLYILVQIYMIRIIITTNYENYSEEVTFRLNAITNPLGDDEEEQYTENSISVFSVGENLERMTDLLTAFYEIVRSYYFIIAIYGQVLLWQGSTSPCSKPLMDLVLVYLIFAYIHLALPIIVIILACICMPVLLFLLIYINRRQNPAAQMYLDKLQVVKMSPDLPGNMDCSICMTDYTPDENLIQLKCSPMHHFHEECLKKWLQINLNCPICRTDFETLYGDKPPPTNPASSRRRRRRRRRRRNQESENSNPDIAIHQNIEILHSNATEPIQLHEESNQITLPDSRNEHRQRHSPATKSPTTLEIE